MDCDSRSGPRKPTEMPPIWLSFMQRAGAIDGTRDKGAMIWPPAKEVGLGALLRDYASVLSALWASRLLLCAALWRCVRLAARVQPRGRTSVNHLLVLRVGYMVSYDGVGEIRGGGSYVDEHGSGGEMWNFRAEAGRCYAYAMSRNFAGIDLSLLAPGTPWSEGDDIDGVDIVFIATRPSVGQVVVGWYLDATVVHRQYRKRRGQEAKGDWETIDYLAEADASNAYLLPEDERVFRVHRGNGLPGQSNVWYANESTAAARNLVADLRAYIRRPEALRKEKPSGGSRTGGLARPDADHMLKVEAAAIAKTWREFEKKRYVLTSVEKDNRGWDLEAEQGQHLLLLEVKGHSGNTVQFELTPNEYSQLRKRAGVYRVCVVRDALGHPDLTVFRPRQSEGTWYLVAEAGTERILLAERTGAKASRVR